MSSSMVPYNVHLGEGSQVYYNKDTKVWVFPGEDPAERARPIGPPPTVTTTPAKSAPPTAPVPSNDQLAALMAPPPRGRPGQTTPNRSGFGIGPIPEAPPQFAVFQPQPKPTEKEE
jgi:hypothetical protein